MSEAAASDLESANKNIQTIENTENLLDVLINKEEPIDSYVVQEITNRQALVIQGLMPTHKKDVPNNLSESVKRMPPLCINPVIPRSFQPPNDLYIDFWNILEQKQANKLKSFALGSFLLLTEAEKKQLPPEEIGRQLDATLITLKSTLPCIKMNYSHVEAISEEIWSNIQASPPGLDFAIRSDLFRQAMQMLSNNVTGVKTHLDVAKKQSLEKDEERILSFSSENESRLLSNLSSQSQDAIFSKIVSISSPFKYSLGNSEIGKKNLTAFESTLQSLASQIELLHAGSRLREIAELVILTQMYQINPHGISENFLSQFSESSIDIFNEYQAFRSEHPVWQDRLQLYKRVYSGESDPDIPDEFRESLRPSVTTTAKSALAFLETGQYLSFHEAFATRGGPQKYYRSRFENATLLLAEGTPTDPYVVYGGLVIKNDKRNQFFQYGDYMIILKSDTFQKTSGVEGDSNFTRQLPRSYPDLLNLVNYLTIDTDQQINLIELEIHGGMTVDDIESINISFDETSEEDRHERDEIERICREKGIEVVYRNTSKPSSTV